jgi:hypothetical protein
MQETPLSSSTNGLGRNACFDFSICTKLQLVASQIRKQKQTTTKPPSHWTNYKLVDGEQTTQKSKQPSTKATPPYLKSCFKNG